ncbi:FAD-dependent oxidoreductase [Bacillota bacterium]
MKSYDVVVIGGGVIGTSVAYHLLKKGFEVALVEKGDIASGTSSHCDAVALICDKQPGIDTQLGYASIQVFIDLAKEFSHDFEFRQPGSLYVCETDQELEVATDYVKQQQADGYAMRMVDNYEMQQMEPYLAKDLIGGIWTEPDASMNPYKLCFAFVEESKKLGLKVYHHHRVLGFKLDEKGAVEGVETDMGTIHTRRVVNCAGVWARELGHMVGLDIPIFPRKGTLLVSEKTEKICHQKVHEFGYMLSKFEDINFTRNVSELVEKHNVAMNIEPTMGDTFLLGGNREYKGFDITTEIEIMRAIAERGIRFFPIIKEINMIRAYSGLRPYCVGHLPIISEVDEIPGYYIAAGHEGDGISMAGITGRMMAQIMAGEGTDFNIDKLKFSRFKGQTFEDVVD